MIPPVLELPIDSIIIGDRIRKDFSHLPELIESLKTDGLLQPIVISQDGKLIAGESRLRAAKQLGWQTIKVSYYEILDEGQRSRLEATENIQRKNFTWIEHCLAVDKVHRYEATQAALDGSAWGMQETARLLGYSGKSSVWYAVTVAEYIRKGDSEILKADSLADAVRVLVNRKEQEANKALVKLTMPKDGGLSILQKPLGGSVDDEFFTSDRADGPKGAIGFVPGVEGFVDLDETPGAVTSVETIIPLSRMLYKGDCIQWMNAQEGPVCDHVITDIPYGIDMDMLNQQNPHGGMKNIDSVAAEHTVDGNKELMAQFFPAAFKVVKDGGFLITWCDQMLWQYMYDLAIAAGWKVQRWPLTWHKTHQCMNQTAQYNFTKNTEIAMVCRKGNAILLSPQSTSLYSVSNDAETRLLGHPFVKPVKLWHWLFQAVATRGSIVLDPFAGVGSSTIAAIQYGLKPLAVELNEEHFNRQIINVQNQYLSLNKSVKFQ